MSTSTIDEINKKEIDSTKLFLVLDLDLTLLQAETKDKVSDTDPPCDFEISYEIGGRDFTCCVWKRPYVDQFLLKFKEHFNVVLYSAGDKQYINEILPHINGFEVFNRIYHREHLKKGYHSDNRDYYKDLAIVASLHKIVMIDDNFPACRFHMYNTIFIAPFHRRMIYSDDWLKSDKLITGALDAVLRHGDPSGVLAENEIQKLRDQARYRWLPKLRPQLRNMATEINEDVGDRAQHETIQMGAASADYMDDVMEDSTDDEESEAETSQAADSTEEADKIEVLFRGELMSNSRYWELLKEIVVKNRNGFYKCPQCKRGSFNRFREAKQHYESKHSTTTFYCKIGNCSTSSKSLNSLENHQRSKHRK